MEMDSVELFFDGLWLAKILRFDYCDDDLALCNSRLGLEDGPSLGKCSLHVSLLDFGQNRRQKRSVLRLNSARPREG